jgi:ribosomal protein S27AE
MTPEQRAKRNTYMREWNRKNVARRREQLQARVRAFLAAGFQAEATCVACGKGFTKTASRAGGSVARCDACLHGRFRDKARRRHRAKYPDRARIYTAVYLAVKKGLLLKGPCAVCGSPDVQAHHADYARPFDVRWLCASCHATEHHPERLAQR